MSKPISEDDAMTLRQFSTWLRQNFAGPVYVKVVRDGDTFLTIEVGSADHFGVDHNAATERR